MQASDGSSKVSFGFWVCPAGRMGTRDIDEMNGRCRHKAVDHDEERSSESVRARILVHQFRDYSSGLGTYLSGRSSRLDEGDLNERPKEMDYTVVVINAEEMRLADKRGHTCLTLTVEQAPAAISGYPCEEQGYQEALYTSVTYVHEVPAISGW